MVNFEVKNLNFSYSGAKSLVLKNIDLKINQGEFVAICGKSGSGKSTLLRMLKPELTPKGTLDGEILFFGKDKAELTQRQSAGNIGFILQNTQYQLATHTVRSELAFGLENLGLDSNIIRLRIAEITAYLSLESIINRNVNELSGGQRQLVCLGSVLAMHPKVIILDEPTAQLDPVAASNFLDTLYKLSTENGITVIITEHRLENVIPIADRVIIMEKGEIISNCAPQKISSELFESNEFVNFSMPFSMKLHSVLKADTEVSLTVSQGKQLLESRIKNAEYTVPVKNERKLSKENAVEMKNVRYAYSNSGFVLNNMSISVKQGSFTAVMGANGAGKTTALSLMGGILECKAGKIKIFSKDIKKYKASELYNGVIALLPQKCESMFAGNTLREDLESVIKHSAMPKDEIKNKINEVSDFMEIADLLDKHPYDISGGEMQRAALAMILLKNPKIILLDEPTKGLDNLFKRKLAEKIIKLCESGVTAVMVSHDTEFCAEYCDECAMIFDGTCVLQTNKYDFFSQNYFYTTAANKISRDIFDSAVTQRQVLDLCEKNLSS